MGWRSSRVRDHLLGTHRVRLVLEVAGLHRLERVVRRAQHQEAAVALGAQRRDARAHPHRGSGHGADKKQSASVCARAFFKCFFCFNKALARARFANKTWTSVTCESRAQSDSQDSTLGCVRLWRLCTRRARRRTRTRASPSSATWPRRSRRRAPRAPPRPRTAPATTQPATVLSPRSRRPQLPTASPRLRMMVRVSSQQRQRTPRAVSTNKASDHHSENLLLRTASAPRAPPRAALPSAHRAGVTNRSLCVPRNTRF